MTNDRNGPERQSFRVGLDPDLARQVRILAACEGVSAPELVQRLLRPVVEKMAHEKITELAGVGR